MKRLPYPDPERLVRLWANLPEEGIERFSFTKIEFQPYAERNGTFEAIGGDFPIDLILRRGSADPERVQSTCVTPGHFETLGAVPILGSAPAGVGFHVFRGLL